MVLRKHYYHSIQRQSRCKDDVYVLDTINAAEMDGTYGTCVDDECLNAHDYDDDTDHDTDADDDTDDETNDGTDDDTDDGGRGNRRPLPGGAEFIS